MPYLFGFLVYGDYVHSENHTIHRSTRCEENAMVLELLKQFCMAVSRKQENVPTRDRVEGTEENRDS
jgi:hypothetical protein